MIIFAENSEKLNEMRLSFALMFLLFCTPWTRAQSEAEEVADTVPAQAAETLQPAEVQPMSPDTLPVLDTLLVQAYGRALDTLVEQRDSASRNVQTVGVVPDAYFYQLLSAPTLYASPMHQLFSGQEDMSGDRQMQRLGEVNRSLAQLYVDQPWLVTQTEEAVRAQGKLREDIAEKIHTEDQLASKVKAGSLTPTVHDKVVVVTRRPNFWKFPSSVALQFTQNYFSSNWPGGENRYAGNSRLILNANFNNEKKITWTNNLDFWLGFQTNKADKNRTFRPTNNSIKYTTNWGYKAYKTLSYSGQVVISTQVVPVYAVNTDRVTMDIFSPMDVTIAPGMRYSFQFGKKKHFTGDVNVAPLAYSIRYVQRSSLVKSYGVRPGHHSRHTFGPNVTLNYKWVINSQLTWTSRVYWYSNLEFTRIDWTNTLNLHINKLLSAQLNVNPKFDDSAIKFRGKHGYWMMQEGLSLGLNYSF